jgi:hypothetical protein
MRYKRLDEPTRSFLMAQTVASHAVAAFTDPQNGQSPIDADQVTSNDNALRVGYVAHDADPGIHLQSSALASRPAFGSAGRKWMTVDGSVARLWFDTGSVWIESTPSTKIATAATVDLSSGASQTLLTHSLANIAAGDVIEVDLNFAWLNGTGVSRSLTLTVDVGGYNMALTSGGIFNPNRLVGNGYWKVAVISSSLVVSNAQFGVSNGVVKGATSGGFSQFSQYNDGSNNLTGTRTVTVSAITSASGADQDLSSVIVQCRLIKGV